MAGALSWESRWGIVLASGQYTDDGLPRTIPLRPIPIGLLISILVWAPACYLVMRVVRRFIRARRRGRGLCTICGYDIRELSACPECGEDV